MACHGIIHLSKGLAYCPQTEIVESERRYVLPLNLNLKNDSIKLNLKSLEEFKLNTKIDTKKLESIKLPSLKVYKKLSTLKLTLKKCEG